MWGMQYSSLDLDTEANRIYCVLYRLCASTITDVLLDLVHHDLLESFDSHRWLLLPLPEMVDKLWDRRQKSMEAPTNAKRQPHIETVHPPLFHPESYLTNV